MEKGKYLITGGAGFIGSHIAEELCKQGHEVRVLDNLRTGYKDNVSDLSVDFVEGDVRDRDLVTSLAIGCKAIFHLGALISVPESLDKVEECITINTLGTINVLEAARKVSNCKVILSSSAANYGDDPQLPKIETMTPRPMTPYAISKLDGEYYLDMYKRQWGVPTISLRYFNVFGPRQDPFSAYAAAVPIFIERALNNQNITIYGDGGQTRDFIYVKDVVKANLFVANQGEGVLNVALGQSTSILSLARLIIDITGSSSKIVFEAERQGDIRHSRADNSKILGLGFCPEHTIIEALEQTISYYQNRIQ